MAKELHETLKAKKWKGQSWKTAQVKLDGFRVTAFIGKRGSIQMYGKDHRPHLEFLGRFPRLKKTDFYRAIKGMPEYSSVDAEIIVPGGTSSDVATALRDQDSKIEIITFAFPQLREKMMDKSSVEWAAQTAYQYGLEFAKWFTRAQLEKDLKLKDASDDKVKKALLKKAEEMGYEGWVLKQTQFKGWFKIKQVQSVDAVITGTVPGNGKFEGLIGALVVGLWDVNTYRVIANVSGMTDAERERLTKLDQQGMLVGQVVEVRYQEIGSQGRLRHPRFSRLRPDKPATHCLYSALAESC